MTGNPLTSFRAELHGLVAWQCCLFHLTQFYDIKAKITIQPYSDNTKVIDYHHHIINNTLPRDPYFDDHDYFSQLQQELKQREVTILLTNKVNCAKDTKEVDQPIEVVLLNQMDNRARCQRQQQSISPYTSPLLDSVYLQDQHGSITSQEKSTLEQQWSTYKVEQYYSRRWKISTKQLSEYDWNIYHKNYTKAPDIHKIYMIKLMTGWLPICYRLNKIMKTQHKCPNCQNDEQRIVVRNHLIPRGRVLWSRRKLRNIVLAATKN